MLVKKHDVLHAHRQPILYLRFQVLRKRKRSKNAYSSLLKNFLNKGLSQIFCFSQILITVAGDFFSELCARLINKLVNFFFSLLKLLSIFLSNRLFFF